MSDKIFCGNGKEFGQYGGINLNICLDDIPEEHTWKGNNGKRYTKLVLSKKKTPDEKSTHYLTVDTWKPSAPSGQDAPLPPVGAGGVQDTEDVPF